MKNTLGGQFYFFQARRGGPTREPFGIAQLFGAMKESRHSGIFVSPYSFGCGIMQKAAGLADVMLQVARRGNNTRSVEDDMPLLTSLRSGLVLD